MKSVIIYLYLTFFPVLGYCELFSLENQDGFLDRSKLIVAVLERNPTLESSYQAIEAVIARYPQVTFLDDPVLSYEIAPSSLFNDKVTFGQMIKLSQRFPFPGKLVLQGQIVNAESWSAAEEYEWTKVQLALIASTLFDDY